MKDDKRRTPYNIWINVLGCILFLLIASVGVLVFQIGLDADQRVVTSTEVCNYCWVEYTYEYDYGIETHSNWQDVFCRSLMYILGIVIIVLGSIAWSFYSSTHYWEKGDKCKIK